ncbi:MAG TPA: universal stress protein [Methylomirabilota bacterium]|nr:universal stress protein [Methylomirabilota bacterium]
MTIPLSFRNILFATDFSETSQVAGRTAAEFARHFGGRLHVLHVVPLVTDPTPAAPALQAAVLDLGAGLSLVTASATGLAASEIVRYARRNAIDLIVMGTHGRTGFSRALLGSVAEAVTRRAGCPVLTVPTVLTGAPARASEVDEVKETTSCLVCGAAAQDDLICESCRVRIRGEALERKRGEERAGRR